MDQMLAQIVNIIGDAAMWLAFEQATILNLTQWRYALLGLLAYEFTNDKNTNNTPKKEYAPSSDPEELSKPMNANKMTSIGPYVYMMEILFALWIVQCLAGVALWWRTWNVWTKFHNFHSWEILLTK